MTKEDIDLIEPYLRDAIAERFYEGMREPEKCGSACEKVQTISMNAVRNSNGRSGIGLETALLALVQLARGAV